MIHAVYQIYCTIAWTLPSICFVIMANAQHTGKISPLDRITIQSKFLKEQRTISIYRPPQVEQFPGSVAPVIYLLDGELVTDLVRAQVGYFCEIWKELPPITVVGIDNAAGMLKRNRDLIPSNYSSTNGDAETFLRFITDELMPLVEKNHRQKPYRVLMGSSLAGFFTIHTFLHHQHLFDAYVASSPSLHTKSNAIMRALAENLRVDGESKKILFLAVGNEGPRYVPNVKKLDSLLASKQLPYLRHSLAIYPGETHGTTPMKSYYDAIRFIFRVGKEDLNIPLHEITYDLLENYYSERSSMFGIPMKPNEFIVNNYGYTFLYETKQTDRAIEFFSMNVKNYPLSANVYDSYAEALLVSGDKQNSLANFEKAVELDPANQTAREHIARLKKELNK